VASGHRAAQRPLTIPPSQGPLGLAVGVGLEPTVARATTVFKSVVVSLPIQPLTCVNALQETACPPAGPHMAHNHRIKHLTRPQRPFVLQAVSWSDKRWSVGACSTAGSHRRALLLAYRLACDRNRGQIHGALILP
jgi:hypothetical protein